MTLFHAPAFTATAAVASILAAAVLTHSGTSTWHRSDSTGTPGTIGCRLDVAPGEGTVLHLTNSGTTTLREGTRFAWTTLGMPAPRGEVRRLPRALEPGASIDVRPAVPASGAGCSAAAYG